MQEPGLPTLQAILLCFCFRSSQRDAEVGAQVGELVRLMRGTYSSNHKGVPKPMQNKRFGRKLGWSKQHLSVNISFSLVFEALPLCTRIVPRFLLKVFQGCRRASLCSGYGMAERIKVILRVRPFNSRETQEEGGTQEAFTLRAPGTVTLVNTRDGAGGDPYSPQQDASSRLASGAQQHVGTSSFGYDHVFASDPDGPCFATQETMFDAVGMPLVENALNAYNGCAFFYGQTGAGKSHSCLGNPKSEEQKGLLPRCCERLFQALQEVKDTTPGEVKYNVLVSYLEIYNEKLSDLLAPKSQAKDLQVRLHPQLGPHVPGLSQLPVLSYDAMDDILEEGAKQRIVAATNMNATSSRSHAIFSVDIRMNKSGVDSQAHIHFVDLAGSERQKKTGAEGDRLKEGIAINQSLSVLGKVISALSSSKKGGPAPFRESKLTLLLKEALSGNSRTVLIACISPSMYNQEESVSTLEFASRCKMIATSAAKNQVDRRDQIEALEAEKKEMEDLLGQISSSP
ncbi:unnamed protein product [Prorocentrum cordatum]|uniref:Kinesin-like protein n=1 Tax=Prorocentrum cordatum TaxID=2364126 RepID=A0ABN9TRV6_9DINO|nr:unnamed protein product [Polarella glacialis]